jgi:hypothetical protein
MTGAGAHLVQVGEAQQHAAVAIVLEGEQVHACGQAALIRQERCARRLQQRAQARLLLLAAAQGL